EAVQLAAHLLNMPIALLSVMGPQQEWIKAAIGLSRLGLMNPLSMTRRIAVHESFGVHIVDSQQGMAIGDTLQHPAFASNWLVQQYGIRAYLGSPLMTSTGNCVGVLAVMDLQPREFTQRDLDGLTLVARLSMSEYERLFTHRDPTALSTLSPDNSQKTSHPSANSSTANPLVNPLKFELLAQLTQELRTPLTSVMGMASVLTREIYGPLTVKQREYLDIIHHSGQYLLSLVKEILELSELEHAVMALNLVSVDIEMLCQQAIATLEQAANRREQQIRLTVEPGNRIWNLDKDKMRQLLYHLIFSLIQASTAGSVIRLHVSNKSNGLKLTIWTTHPCLGEGNPYAADLYPGLGYEDSLGLEFGSLRSRVQSPSPSTMNALSSNLSSNLMGHGTTTLMAPPVKEMETTEETAQRNLGLLLSRQLVELHSGQIQIQGSGASKRYVISLPRLTPNSN
ncbi:MAG: GAF domain-containing sensor histidine kinase, partial [Synechococcales bacterium]|nr:GAF domain-containing sensor histidine kinase [Synechococcales bacterium]